MDRNAVIAAACAAGVLALGTVAAFAPISQGFWPWSSVPPPPPPFAAFGPDCQIAPVNADHLFLSASTYQGDTLTNVQLGDESNVTTMVRISVTPGSKPITVLLQSSQAVIWNFEGAVGRVARAMIVAGDRDRAAVAGLLPAQVDMVKLTRCPEKIVPFEQAIPWRRDGILYTLFGRSPDKVAKGYSPNSISLPDLEYRGAPSDGPEQTAETAGEKALLSYFKGGFRMVDPKSLVSRAEVLTPETYPDAAGLIQLERAGAIRPPRQEELDQFAEGLSKPFRSKLSPNYRLRVGFSYVILRDVKLPAGLYGAHLKNFLVMPGVPAPRGSVGHGCLAFMDSFKAEDRSCYSDAWDSIERLRKLPDANTASCRVVAPSAEAGIEAVSMYEPKKARHSFGSARTAVPVEINVTKSGPIWLVLNTYEPAIWRIIAGEGTQIEGVILTGYYASKVEGIPAGTPVIQIDYENRNNRPPANPGCAPLYEYLGSSFRGGPGAMVLDRQIGALTGRSIDRLRGDYAVERVEIQ
jgi:hypothetical protein